MNRRHLILSAAGAGLAVSGLGAPTAYSAQAPTDDELAYANFALAAEYLLQDFYAKTAAAKLLSDAAARELVRGGFCASEHATALTALLTNAGQTAAAVEDFSFAWPSGTFKTKNAALAAGTAIAEALLGVYLGAASTITISSYRTLFASMAASLAQQVAALSREAGGRVVGVSFPSSLDVETASGAIDAYLG